MLAPWGAQCVLFLSLPIRSVDPQSSVECLFWYRSNGLTFHHHNNHVRSTFNSIAQSSRKWTSVSRHCATTVENMSTYFAITDSITDSTQKCVLCVKVSYIFETLSVATSEGADVHSAAVDALNTHFPPNKHRIWKIPVLSRQTKKRLKLPCCSMGHKGLCKGW